VTVLLSLLTGSGLLLPAPAGATPGIGSGNWAVYDPDTSNTPYGQMCFYDNNTQAACVVAGSGHTDDGVGLNDPCNKYKGDYDGNGGGRLPGSWYNSPSGWTTSAPYGQGLTLSNGTAYGSIYDCAATGSVLRTELFVHCLGTGCNGSYVTNGCIKLSGDDLYWFSIRYHFIWGGGDGVAATSTVAVMSF
jgi:hypothetical protein